MPFTFRFRWIPFVATALAVATGISLGQWQTRRAVAKQAIETKLTARAAEAPMAVGTVPQDVDTIEYRRVVVRGEFVRGWPVYLDNRPHQGVAGFYLLMPLKIAGSDMHVLVMRGWIPRDMADRTRLARTITPDGMVEVGGVARRNPGRVLQLGAATIVRPNAIVQNLDIAGLSAASKMKLQPFLIEQSSDAQDGLLRDWPKPSSGIDKHRGYAFQWYGLAAMAFLFFVVTGFRRGTKQATR